MLKNTNLLYIKIGMLIILLFAPWFLNSSFESENIDKITSDLRFYEINTCKISLGEFLLNNINVIYQDHYKIRYNNYSSISCYGTITGVDQIGHDFYISIGTNSFINIILQSIFFLTVLSLVKKSEKEIIIKNKTYLLSSSICSLILIYGIFGEKRFYSKSLYFLDLDRYISYKNLYLIFFTIGIYSLYIFNTRNKNLINFIPWSFIFIGVFSGFNLAFPSIFLMNLGIIYVINNYKKIYKISSYYLLLVIVWIFTNSNYDYYLDPDKIRGFVNTSYNDSSILYWSLLFYLVVAGIWYFAEESFEKFSYINFEKNYLIVGSLIFTTGILAANFPLINFLTYIYSGQQKFSTSARRIFDSNEWSEILAWRGFFPSAETIGEFYAFGLLIMFLYHYKFEFKTLSIKNHWMAAFLIIGLITSNNRAALLSLVLVIILFINRYVDNNKLKFYGYLTFLICLFAVIGFSNLQISFDYTGNKLLEVAGKYSVLDKNSSSFEYLNNTNNFIVKPLLILISTFALLINRSELWGIFIARYNPDLLELLFGSGPLTLSKLFGDIKGIQTKSFLLAHSSLIELLVFIGLINLIFLSFFILSNLNKIKANRNYYFYYSLIFMSINLIKSDSIFYFPFVLLYTFFLFIGIKLKTNEEIININEN